MRIILLNSSKSEFSCSDGTPCTGDFNPYVCCILEQIRNAITFTKEETSNYILGISGEDLFSTAFCDHISTTLFHCNLSIDELP